MFINKTCPIYQCLLRTLPLRSLAATQQLPVFQSSGANAEERITGFLQPIEDVLLSGHGQRGLEMVTALSTQHSFPHSPMSAFHVSKDWNTKKLSPRPPSGSGITKALPVRCTVQNLGDRSCGQPIHVFQQMGVVASARFWPCAFRFGAAVTMG